MNNTTNLATKLGFLKHYTDEKLADMWSHCCNDTENRCVLTDGKVCGLVRFSNCRQQVMEEICNRYYLLVKGDV